ncbi:lytic transglycosylase domain-containing protein [Blastomonas sp. AAP53]|uniref:lytic transglycosylase domain-containing protein n=1 Tax=Blastomonas sp. AAP53 TaxID=1248760 RepID=UPI0009DB2698|nr:lytic transglycosylase domain-containing protein [Blastomonas sp. AAP53]
MTLAKWLGSMTLALLATAPVALSAESALPSGQAIVVDIDAHVREASLAFGLPEQWLHAVIRRESAGKVTAVSSAGAMGLMQVMPATWERQRRRFALGNDPFNPRDNILAGASYLREMFDLFGPDGFLAAYNAGPGRYRQWRDKGRPLPAETRAYVAVITAELERSGSIPFKPIGPQLAQNWTSSMLFPTRPFAGAKTDERPPAMQNSRQIPAPLQPTDRLFAITRTEIAR